MALSAWRAGAAASGPSSRLEGFGLGNVSSYVFATRVAGAFGCWETSGAGLCRVKGSTNTISK